MVVKPQLPDSSTAALQRLKDEKIALIRKRQEMVKNLPHLYGRKWYRWAKAFFDSCNRMNLLCAANQISKGALFWPCLAFARATRLEPYSPKDYSQFQPRNPPPEPH